MKSGFDNLTNYQLKQIEEAKGLVEKFKKSKNFEQKKNEKILEESWASNQGKCSADRKFCLVVNVSKHGNKAMLGIAALSQKEIIQGNYASFEMPNEQLYHYGELIKVM